MPRPRIYANDAERKRASRERIRQSEEAEERERAARPQAVTFTPGERRELHHLMQNILLVSDDKYLKSTARKFEKLLDHPDYHPGKRDNSSNVTKRIKKRDTPASVTNPEEPLPGQLPIF